jgi:glutaredoxin-like protein NrdH
MTLQHVAGKNKGHVVLYALSTCPWCRKTKKLLEDLGVEYYFGDVDLMNETDKNEALRVIQKWNPGSSFPTMIIDDAKCIIGFQENKIRETFSK